MQIPRTLVLLQRSTPGENTNITKNAEYKFQYYLSKRVFGLRTAVTMDNFNSITELGDLPQNGDKYQIQGLCDIKTDTTDKKKACPRFCCGQSATCKLKQRHGLQRTSLRHQEQQCCVRSHHFLASRHQFKSFRNVHQHSKQHRDYGVGKWQSLRTNGQVLLQRNWTIRTGQRKHTT